MPIANYYVTMLPELSKEQKIMIVGLVGVIVIGCSVAFFNRYIASSGESAEVLISEAPVENAAVEEQSWMIVHVSGAVKREGVYKLKGGDRVYDLIVLAGGPAEDADLENINFASALSDSQKIIIPYKSRAPTVALSPFKKKSEKAGPSIVNLNSAGQSELVSLPGIGKSTAGKIIELRDKKGRFSDISELKEIRGISDKKIKKLSPYLKVN
ncbi:helix-hairpin-helix domain-containing protein [Candidatus Margulisiibacteriota bacterium]